MGDPEKHFCLHGDGETFRTNVSPSPRYGKCFHVGLMKLFGGRCDGETFYNVSPSRWCPVETFRNRGDGETLWKNVSPWQRCGILAALRGRTWENVSPSAPHRGSRDGETYGGKLLCPECRFRKSGRRGNIPASARRGNIHRKVASRRHENDV